MNALLAQFVAETRDLVAQASEGLLLLERAPSDAGAVSAVFRAVHTVKGAAGIFELRPIDTLVHAAEDLLDGARKGAVALDGRKFDLLLRTLDLLTGWMDALERTGELPDEAGESSRALSKALRAELDAASPEGVQETALESVPTGETAAWVPYLADGVKQTLRTALEEGESLTCVTYLPRAECFFSGDDPLQLMAQVPGLLFLELSTREPLPELSALDPFQCVLELRAVTSAPRDALTGLFRYVDEEVCCASLSLEALLRSPEQELAEKALREQLAILRLPVEPGQAWDLRLSSAARVLENTLRFVGADDRVEALAVALEESESKASTDAVVALLARWTGEEPAPVTSPIAGALGSSGGAVASSSGSASGSRVLRVDQSRIDQLMALVGELIVAKNGLEFLARRAELHYGSRPLSAEIKERYAVMHRIAEELQSAVMQVRMLPVSTVFQRFPRLVRDLSRTLGKEIELVMEGEDVEADKNIIDRLGDPLVHLVRNSLDHGIETPEQRSASGKAPTARLVLRAVQEGQHVHIEVRDDGRGIDPARIRQKAMEKGLMDAASVAALSDQQAIELVFAAGFSTAEKVSELSGRGVGMDVVRRGVEELGGQLTLQSKLGEGTTLRLSLPISMAVTRVLRVRVGDDFFGVPVDDLLEVMKAPRRRGTGPAQPDLVSWRDRLVPVKPLSELLKLAEDEANAAAEDAVLICRVRGRTLGLRVDGFEEATDALIKPLKGMLAQHPAFLGSAILGDGRVLLVLSLKDLIE